MTAAVPTDCPVLSHLKISFKMTCSYAYDRNILKDEIIEFEMPSSREKYPGRLRRVTAFDPEKKVPLVFLTNHFSLASTTITAVYKDRWQIEIFFKTIKQNLKVKTFV